MLIKSIELQNFRCFNGSQKIDFSTDRDRNVTIILADNGSGKTTLSQAFSWCLYGTTTFKNNNELLSSPIRDDLNIGQTATVMVSLVVVHKGKEYRITRSQEYRKDDVRKTKAESVLLSVSYKADDGQTEYIEDEADKKDIINEIIPSSISSYFFFDGERVEKMGNEIQGGKSKEFKTAVENLLGLSAISEAIRHLKGGPGMVIQSFNKDYNSNADEDYQDAENLIQACEERIANLESKIESDKFELGETQSQADQYHSELEKLKESKELAEERTQKINEAKTLKENKDAFLNSIMSKFSMSSWEFFITPLLKSTLEAIEASSIDLSKEAPVGVNADTIKELIEKKVCLCGTPIEFNSPEYESLINWISVVPPEHIGSAVRNFKEQCNLSLEQSSQDMVADITFLLQQYRNSEEGIFKLEERIEDISNQLKEAKQSTYIEDMYRAAKRRIDDLSGQIDSNNQALGMAKSDLQKAISTRDSLETNDATNKRVRRDKEYAEYIFEELNNDHKHKEAETRNDLEAEINSIFNEFFSGNLSLRLDEKYNVHVKDSDHHDGYEVETSEGQTVAVIFAFIAGVIRLATDQKRAKDEMLLTEAYPLVMDAPMSKLDKKRIASVCDVVPKIAEQAVIMIKDTDGELAREHLTQKIGYEYEVVVLEPNRSSEFKQVEANV